MSRYRRKPILLTRMYTQKREEKEKQNGKNERNGKQN